MPKGYSIRLFLPDGEPEGLKLIDKTNWSGRGVVCPRSLYESKREREEFERTGVYVLIGEGDGVLPDIYIGEAEKIRSRLDSHIKEAKFDWTQVTFFVSKDDYLNKAHARYLEWRLIDLATKAKRAKTHNGNAGSKPSLSEADRAEAEGFLDEMLLCFPLVGLDLFETPPPRKTTVVGSLLNLRDNRNLIGLDMFARPPSITTMMAGNLLTITGKGLTARGYEAGSKFVVKKGSQASLTEVRSIPPSSTRLRNELRANGVLTEENGYLVFTQDYAFTSPSQAAGVVLGRSANGRVEWRDGEGRTLKDIQEATEFRRLSRSRNI
jgi:hypothetical protein